MTAASATSTTERRLERPPGPVAALGRALPVVTILVLLVALAAVAAQVPSARRDVAALEAAGMPSRRAWRVASTWIGLLVAAGAAVGALGVLVGMTLLSDSISAAFGQRWTSVDLPWVSLLLVVLVPLLICVAPVQRADALLSWLRRDDRAAWGTGRAAAITGVAAVGAGVAAICLALLALHGHVEVRQPWGLGMLGLVAVAIGARLAANALAGTRRPRATAAVIRRLAGQLTTGTSVALLIGTACAGYSAWLTHDTRALAGLNLAPQRPGSFLVYEAPAAAADQVLERYRSAGGRHAVLYQLPDEADGTVRVITTALMACVHAEAGGAPDPVQPCLEQAHGQEAAMGLPALDPDLPAGTVLAAKDLVDPAGQTGLVAYAPDGSGRVTRTGTTRATASPELGGNMPGLVLSPNGPLAQDYGLKPSGLVEFGIFDFGHLDPRLAAQIRAQVATLAPAAQVSDSTESTSTDQDLAIALVVALAGAVLALILQTSTAAAVVSGGRRLRTTIASVGITATQRLAISLRVVAPALVGVTVAWLATAIVAPRLSMRADVSMGWAWMLPYAVQAAVMLITGVVLLRAPRDC